MSLSEWIPYQSPAVMTARDPDGLVGDLSTRRQHHLMPYQQHIAPASSSFPLTRNPAPLEYERTRLVMTSTSQTLQPLDSLASLPD
jgi:hypothetical protein